MSQLELIEEIASYTLDPLGCVNVIFPWGEGELADSKGPRVWQAEILSSIGTHLQNPGTRFQPFMAAIASGHDIGKSALVAMIVKWGLSTCEDCRIMITANTGNQLSSKTQPEVAKWFRLAEDREFWEVQATRIACKDVEHKPTWRADFETWTENNTEAFAGLHNKGKRIIVIFDEASAIVRPIWEVTKGALTDEETEIIWLAFGNPTINSGPFYECFGSQAHRWKHRQIDSRTVEGTNKAEIARWIEDYGEDHDFVRVRVRGEFPRSGTTQFIASDVVAAARRNKAEGYTTLPKILSLDVARFGDDQSIFGLRQGRKFQILSKHRGWDTDKTSLKLIEYKEKYSPEATVVDGDGIGGGVIDNVKGRGFGNRLFEFHGGASADDSNMYYNKRAEVWGWMRDWFNIGGTEIPDDVELDADLTSIMYGTARGKRQNGSLILESKDDMKKRGLSSPDCADCLAMTFSVKIAPPLPKAETVSSLRPPCTFCLA